MPQPSDESIVALQDEERQSREKYHAAFIDDMNKEIAQESNNDDNAFWKQTRLLIRSISSRYTHYNRPVVLYEYDLHELWYIFIEAAKITSANHAAQDRLASQILHAREMGSLSRTVSAPGPEGAQRIETATTSNGRIWTDLPFLVGDLRKAWSGSLHLSVIQRHNLSAFTARLVAGGICGSELSSCAIWVLRDALETPRRLTASDQRGDSHEVPVAEFLPAAVAWFEYSGHKIESLAIGNYSLAEEADLHLTALGELAREARVAPQQAFSVSRWLFWRARFEELSHCGHEEVAQTALRGFKMMKFWGENIELVVTKS